MYLTSLPTCLPQLVASTVLVTARLARLKVELVNVLYMLPEKPMRWVDTAAAAREVWGVVQLLQL